MRAQRIRKALSHFAADVTPRYRSDTLNGALSDALKAVTLDDIDGWFRHCGY